MRKLVALLAFLAFAPSAMAEGADISHNGDMRIRYKSDSVAAFDKANANTTTSFDHRVRVGTTFRKGDKFTGYLGLNHSATWGSNFATGQYPTTFNAANGLIVNEAYVSWMASDEVLVRAGRGGFTMGDGKVVSKNDYENIHKAFDGMMVSYDTEFARASFFFVRGAELTGGAVLKNDPKGDFTGISVDFKSLPDFLKKANLHYVMINSDATTTITGEESNRIGLSASGDMMNINYGISYASNTGNTLLTTTGKKGTDIEGSMMEVHVGYAMPEMMNFKVGFDYHSDTGAKAADTKLKDYRPFHYDSHYHAGLMDVLGWGNLTYMKLGLSLDAMEGLNVGLDYYTFTQTEKDGQWYNTAGTGTATADATKDDLGSEIDLVIKKKYDDAFSVEAHYGQFSPGKAISAGTDTHTQMKVIANMTF